VEKSNGTNWKGRKLGGGIGDGGGQERKTRKGFKGRLEGRGEPLSGAGKKEKKEEGSRGSTRLKRGRCSPNSAPTG